MEPLDSLTADLEAGRMTLEEYNQMRPYEHETILGRRRNVSKLPSDNLWAGVLFALQIEALILILIALGYSLYTTGWRW